MDFYRELLKINNKQILNSLQKEYENHDLDEYYKENNYIFHIKSNNSIKYNFHLYKSLTKYIGDERVKLSK